MLLCERPLQVIEDIGDLGGLSNKILLILNMKLSEINNLTKEIIGAAIEVHRTLGPGLLEEAYEAALAYELNQRGFKTNTQVHIPIIYKNIELDKGYRADIIVNDEVILELKATEKEKDIFYKQLLTYLRLSNKRIGLLINFNKEKLTDGVRRVINGEIPI